MASQQMSDNGIDFKDTGSERQYIELYTQQREAIFTHSADVLNSVRDEAFRDFCKAGFPTRKVERYKYTDIPALFKPDYGVNINRLDIPVNPRDVFACDVPNMSTSLYFVVNDSFDTKALPKAKLPEGVIVDSLRNVAQRQPELIAKHYAQLAKSGEDAITALNTMLAQDGLVVYVPRNTVVDRAIQVVNITRGDVSMMINRRVLVIVEDGAEAKILFCDHSVDDREMLTTQVTEAYVGCNAKLDLYCLEETNYKNRRVSNIYFKQERDSRLTHNVITLQNGITRNKADLVFAGEGAECMLCGCAIENGEEHVDNNTVIDHQAGHCTSNELYKYVLDDKSVGAFAGKVLVREGAQKTVSNEVNRNLCVTKQARMYTQPMLEIYADDVKCSHGSTAGQLNDAAMFYMQQRGISTKEAKMLLEIAFINEVIDHVNLEPLRDRLYHLVEKRFRNELGACSNCMLNAKQ